MPFSNPARVIGTQLDLAIVLARRPQREMPMTAAWIEVRPPAYSRQPVLRIALPAEIVAHLAMLPTDSWIESLLEAVAHSAGHRFDELVRSLRASNSDTLAVFTVLGGATQRIDTQSTRRVGADFWRIM